MRRAGMGVVEEDRGVAVDLEGWWVGGLEGWLIVRLDEMALKVVRRV
jgi:hypothetical protein